MNFPVTTASSASPDLCARPPAWNHLPRTAAALTAYGGLVAWSALLKHLGIIERCADRCPVPRTSPNAAPVREVLHSFALAALVEGNRFCHVRWLTDDPALATVMNLARVRGEDALRAWPKR